MVGKKNLFIETEELLKNYNDMVYMIEMFKKEIEIYEREYEGCGSISYEEKTGVTNKFNSSVENEIIKRERKTEKIKEKLDEKMLLKNRIDCAIASLKLQEERDLIKLRYINNPQISWGNIARHLGYDKDHCRKKIAPRAIRKIANFIFYDGGIQNKFIV
ncbi:sigma factor-like helix-turn-helix DNA-binding protein [Clostridium baratii]|uniref:DUF722 domain-containing protein n=1 Tax=Clostridium baratii TaxID=1561 RepID=UPI0036F332E6